MRNAKPGAHPLTDLLVHRRKVFSPWADRTIRDLARHRTFEDIYRMFDWEELPEKEAFEGKLRAALSEARAEAKKEAKTRLPEEE